jgi:hypothetical protein
MKKLIRQILKEEVSERLKKVIKNKLSKELSNVEIILHKDGSIWFIDRNEKYWFFELKNSGHLWWRDNYFINFFNIFSMDEFEFEPIIKEWVEEVLDSKVVLTISARLHTPTSVEEVLNQKDIK